MSSDIKIDPETGTKERTVDIEGIMEASKIPMWARPKGVDIFKRNKDAVDFVYRIQKQELWLYNRQILTGPST